MTYTFYRNCVNWPAQHVHSEGGLVDMIDQATDITRATFRKHVDNMELIEIERALGYDTRPGFLHMAGDWHVSYHRSKLHGQRVYFFKHSAIEYVFTEQEKQPQ